MQFIFMLKKDIGIEFLLNYQNLKEERVNLAPLYNQPFSQFYITTIQ